MKIEIKLILEYDSQNMTEEEKRKKYEQAREYFKRRSVNTLPPLDTDCWEEGNFIDLFEKWSYDVSADENAMFKPE